MSAVRKTVRCQSRNEHSTVKLIVLCITIAIFDIYAAKYPVIGVLPMLGSIILARAQPNLVAGRRVGFYAECTKADKANSRLACANANSKFWLATPRASDFTPIKNALQICGSATACAWLDGYQLPSATGNSKTDWYWAEDIGGTVESVGWANTQPRGNSAPRDITWGRCYDNTGDGWGNDGSAQTHYPLCMYYPCTRTADCNNHGTPPDAYLDPKDRTSVCKCICEKYYVGRNCRSMTLTTQMDPTRTLKQTVSLSGTPTMRLTKTIALPATSSNSITDQSTKTKTEPQTRSATTTIATRSGTKTVIASTSSSLARSGTFSHLSSLSRSTLVSQSNTATLSATFSLSGGTPTKRITLSLSPSPSESHSHDVSASLSIQGSVSRSPSRTWATGSAPRTLSASATVSSTSSKMTKSGSETRNSTTTTSQSASRSLSHSSTCVYYESMANVTCRYVMFVTNRESLDFLLRGEVPNSDMTDLAKDKKVDSNAATPNSLNCDDPRKTPIRVPYSVWKGRGSFVLAITPSQYSQFGSFNPVMEMPTTLQDAPDFVLESVSFFTPSVAPQTPSNETQTSQISFAEWRALNGHKFLLLTIRYTSRATLNEARPFFIDLNPRNLFACPLPGTLSFQILPEAAPRTPLPEGLAETATMLSSLLMLPSAAVLLGMLTSMQSMARCESANLDEEPDLFDNPLGLAIGPEGHTGRYQRGAIAGAILIYIIFGSILSIMSISQWALRRFVNLRVQAAAGVQQQKVEAGFIDLLKEIRFVASIGFPSALLPCSAFILDGVSNAGMSLLAFSPYAFDRVIGVAVIITILTYIAHVGWIAHKTPLSPKFANNWFPAGLFGCLFSKRNKVMSGSLEIPMLDTANSLDEGNVATLRKHHQPNSPTRLKDLIRYFVAARCEWEANDESLNPLPASTHLSSSAIWDGKYHHYVADVMPSVKIYRSVELLCGNLVASLEALAFTDTTYCAAKIAATVVVLLSLLAIIGFLSPMAVRAGSGFVSFTLFLQIVAGCVLVANVFAQEVELEVVASQLTLVATLFVLLTTAVETVWFVIENFQAARLALHRLWSLKTAMRNRATDTDSDAERGVAREEEELERVDQPKKCEPQVEVATPSESESDIVRAILSNLNEFDRSQDRALKAQSRYRDFFATDNKNGELRVAATESFLLSGEDSEYENLAGETPNEKREHLKQILSGQQPPSTSVNGSVDHQPSVDELIDISRAV